MLSPMSFSFNYWQVKGFFILIGIAGSLRYLFGLSSVSWPVLLLIEKKGFVIEFRWIVVCIRIIIFYISVQSSCVTASTCTSDKRSQVGKSEITEYSRAVRLLLYLFLSLSIYLYLLFTHSLSHLFTHLYLMPLLILTLSLALKRGANSKYTALTVLLFRNNTPKSCLLLLLLDL